MMVRDRAGGSRRLRDGVGRLMAAAWMIALALPSAATAQMLTVEETEDLVRGRYYEGMPLEEVERISPDGCNRLVEMLEDPEESRSHGQILVAIGICGPEGGFEAIRDWDDTPRAGEIDRDTFRAWQSVPSALAHLARHDRRALARLEARLNDPEAPRWTFRHHRGARLVSQSRRSAASCLARTGMPEAAEALDRADRFASDQRFREHLQRVREVHRRARQSGDAWRPNRRRGGARGGAR